MLTLESLELLLSIDENHLLDDMLVTLLSTPLYSNTTLVVFFPTLALGGCVLLMPKFDALGYLQLAERQRVTHTMLVPVQYQRLMAHPAFDAHDLSSYRFKFSTSAPFHAALAGLLDARPGAVLVAVHSFTPRLRGGASRPMMAGLLVRRDRRLAEALMRELAARAPAVAVVVNQPYRIEDDSDCTIPVHGERRGLPHVLIEIRSDLIADAVLDGLAAGAVAQGIDLGASEAPVEPMLREAPAPVAADPAPAGTEGVAEELVAADAAAVETPAVEAAEVVEAEKVEG